MSSSLEKTSKTGPRVIMHVDMDAFYASVEQLDHPEYRGRPLAVGTGERSVISAASYEIRKFGVRSAMPVATARKLCPQGIFVPVRMHRYIEVSRRVMEVLRRFSPLVEQASVDEAYLDVSGTGRLFGPPYGLARRIKGEVLEHTGLTCSIGIAPNKFLAKIASDQNKPNGITLIEPDRVREFLRELPVARIPGVGKKSLPGLKRLGIEKAGDILRYPKEFWATRFGERGKELYDRAMGIHDRPVVPYTAPKSVSAENTFSKDTEDRPTLAKWIIAQSERVGAELRKTKVQGRTVTLKIKYADFKQITRSRTLNMPTDSTKKIIDTAKQILDREHLAGPVRLIGVGVSGFEKISRQLSLFAEEDGKTAELDKAVDLIREKFGKSSLKRGEILDLKTHREE